MIPVFVINLERDRERRAATGARLDALNIPHTFIKAVDGRALTPEELERASPREKLAFPYMPMPGLTGNGLSHLSAIAEGARLDCDYFCVFEDDIIPAPALASCLDRATLAALPEFDALRLFTHLDRWDKPSKIVAYIQDHVVVRMLRPGWGCQGQVYSREGARKILATIKHVTAPFDFVLYHDCHVSGLRVLEVRPGMVVRDTARQSSIGDRPPNSREDETLIQRLDRNTVRLRRKLIAAISFFRAWGVREFFSFFSMWR